MNKTQPTHKKLPRGCIKKLLHEDYWMAVIPCHAPAQASQIVRAAEFLRLPEEEKVERLTKAISNADANDRASYAEMASSALSAMGMGGPSK